MEQTDRPAGDALKRRAEARTRFPGEWHIPLVLLLSELYGFSGVLARQAVSDFLTAAVGATFTFLVLRHVRQRRGFPALATAEHAP